ncbi:helix-turn-helix domain-containing protein [Streptomyces iconiensis]|uniref:Helix-turn-helix transcriptional regulator n=1 Tax=Streptomyces iconiensis TaxID=1384038 RepID=A0ABT6ZRR3_9ACTN|nr:helix-turn-helix transcriptional regulator [Streptomyces iconiensis]MDJ1131740.1 helix-turn-helix transcriptional regulator [Streptomyces iconiensis]
MSEPSEPDFLDCQPTPLVRSFGNTLKKWREHRKLSRDEIGDKTGFSASTIGAFERGDRIADGRTVQALDAALNAHQLLAVLGEDLENEQYPKKFDQLFRLEAGAASLSTYDTNLINGLLQTEAYARALFEARVPCHSPKRIDYLLTARLSRQSLLTRDPIPVLCFVLDEAVLLRRTGGRDVLREQLQHLLEVGKLNHVRIAVLPLDCEEPVGAVGPMTLLETSDRRMLGYVEVQGEGTLVSDKEDVSTWRQRFGMIQANALRPAESARLIQRRMEEL